MSIAARIVAELIVIACDVDRDLVVEGASTNVIDLLEHVPGTVLVAFAVRRIRSDLEDDAELDSPPLVVIADVIPRAADTESLLGTVLNTSVSSMTIAFPLGLEGRKPQTRERREARELQCISNGR